MDEAQLKEKLHRLLEPEFYIYPEVPGMTRLGQRVRPDFIVVPRDRAMSAGLIEEPIAIEVKAANKKDCHGAPIKAFAQCVDYLWGYFPVNGMVHIPYAGFVFTGYTQDVDYGYHDNQFFNGIIRLSHQFRVGFIRTEARYYRYEFFMGDVRWFYKKENGDIYASQAGQLGKFKAGNRSRHRESAA